MASTQNGSWRGIGKSVFITAVGIFVYMFFASILLVGFRESAIASILIYPFELVFGRGVDGLVEQGVINYHEWVSIFLFLAFNPVLILGCLVVAVHLARRGLARRMQGKEVFQESEANHKTQHTRSPVCRSARASFVVGGLAGIVWLHLMLPIMSYSDESKHLDVVQFIHRPLFDFVDGVGLYLDAFGLVNAYDYEGLPAMLVLYGSTFTIAGSGMAGLIFVMKWLKSYFRNNRKQ